MNDSGIRERIRRARDIFTAHGAAILEDAPITSALVRYGSLIDQTQESMCRMGVVDQCGACARDSPGSCCFDGIEEGYGVSLLLLNLLMECELPEEKMVSGSCLFVGEYGCLLRARYYFCLHYLCPRLKDALGAERTRKLLQTLGEELHAGWEAETALIGWLRVRDANFQEL